MIAHPRRRRGYPLLVLLCASVALGAVAAICGPAQQEAETPTTDPAGTPGLSETPTQSTLPTPTVDAARPPTATTTLEPTRTPIVVQYPTPASDSEVMGLGGTVWLDARPAYGNVRALINGIECGVGQSGRLTEGASLPLFAIGVHSAEEVPGCGTRGAVVNFTINDRPVNETLEWTPGVQPLVELIAGPPFARYYGSLYSGADPLPSMKVVPYIDGRMCGAQLNGGERSTGEFWYFLVVDPEELVAGCGRRGAQVTLSLEMEGQPPIDLGTESWETAARVDRPTLDLRGKLPEPSDQ